MSMTKVNLLLEIENSTKKCVANRNEIAAYFYSGHGQRPDIHNENGGNLCTSDKKGISLKEFCTSIKDAGF